MANTIDYYNSNAKQFADSTKDVAFTAIQDKFLGFLKPGAKILDFGCGSGRDTKYFLESGYDVDAIDGSVELCKLASEYTGINVKHLYFEQLDAVEIYDGIWACSSILHVKKEMLPDVVKKMITAVKPGGYIYVSFKYGDFSGERNGRFFTDLNEESLSGLLEGAGNAEIVETWKTSDARPGREDEKWLNSIIRKWDIS